MPAESEVMPIGQEGQFLQVVELIWIEDEDRRRILTKDGRLLFDSNSVTTKSQPVIQRPAMSVGRVCEFDIQRFGFRHSDEELKGVRDTVNSLAESLNRPLRMIDTYGWSGEIALAMFRPASDTVTIVDDLSGVDRGLDAWVDADEHRDVLFSNLGPLLETWIQYSPHDAAELPLGITNEFDLVFIDTVSSQERVMNLIDAWAPRLSEEGVLIGVSPFFKSIAARIRENLSEPTFDSTVGTISKQMLEAWHDLQEQEVDVA